MDMINNVIKAMDGDQEAISELYYATYPKLHAVAVSILKNDADADDIVQDSYIKAFSSLHQLDNAERFEPWLCRIVSNKCKDYLKKNKPILFSSQNTEDDNEPIEWSIEDDSKEYDPEAVLISADIRRQIMELLDTLPDEQRICLVYHVVQEMKISEIAELLEVSENTVKSRINYAKSKMQVKIDELEKKGVKLRGFAGFALFPFIRYLFASESVSIPPISTEIITSSVASAAETTTAVAETIATSSSVAIGETAKTVVGHTIKHLGVKIVSSIVAVIITAATIIGVTNLLSSREGDISQNPNESTETSTLSSNTDLSKEDYTNYYLIDPFDAIEYICYVEESKSFIIRQTDNYAKEYDNGWKINNIGKRDDGSIYISRAGSTDDNDYGYFFVNEDSYNGNKVTVKFALSKEIIDEYKKSGVNIVDTEKEFVVTKGEYVKDTTTLESLSLYDIKGFKRGCRIFFWSDKKDADSDTENLFEFVTEHDWSSMTNTTGCSIYYYKNLIMTEQGEVITQGNGTTIYNSQMYGSDEAFVSIDDYISTYYTRWISQIELLDY